MRDWWRILTIAAAAGLVVFALANPLFPHLKLGHHFLVALVAFPSTVGIGAALKGAVGDGISEK